MDAHQNQEEPSSDGTITTINPKTMEETPLIQIKANGEEENNIPLMPTEVYEWNTSLISQICREGDVHRLRLFVDFTLQMSSCAQLASNIVDRLDIDTGLSPLHHAARHRQLHICLMLLSNIRLTFGVNIKDENGQTPIHSAFRSSAHNSNTGNQFMAESDFGNEIQKCKAWKEDYEKNILRSEHPIIYLFAKTNGDINARDKYLLTPLHYAVANQNLSGVKQLITLNADIESQDRQGIRPLHLACKEGILPIVEYLLEQGAQIDCIDADGWTTLHHACAKGHLDTVELIYTKENSRFEKLILMKTNTDATCLHLAVQNGNNQLVEYILTRFTKDNRRILLDQQAATFGTPLHIAAKFCDPSMIGLLYDYGADPSLLNSNEESALHIACASNRLLIVQELHRLTQTSLLEIKNKQGRTALSVTTNSDIVDQLITYGAEISSLDKDHMNALMIAVSTCQTAIVKRFLSCNSHQLLSIIDQTDKKLDRSIFLIAIQSGSVDICSLLLTESYIPWDTADKQRMNAFHIAAQNNHHELITLLCNHIRESNKLLRKKSHSSSVTTMIDSNEANVQQRLATLHMYIDAQNEDGKTPLHFASEQGHALCVEVLLNNHANVLIANHIGQLPLHYAIQNGHGQCVDLLINLSRYSMSEFQSALFRKQSPLITACRNGFADIVKLLISENIGINDDIGFDSETDENPLEMAIKYRHSEIVHILLEHPLCEYWLSSIRNSPTNCHQTPLRDLIQYMPDCAQHAFDKLIVKTNQVNFAGNTIQQTNYKYKYLDDYFIGDNKLYTNSSYKRFCNHPLIIAFGNNHHVLLEHPLVKQLMLRKWKLYRPFFYFPRILSVLLLLILTFYVLITPSPHMDSSLLLLLKPIKFSKIANLIIKWIIVILSIINLLKIFTEIFLFRGLRTPFAQLFGLISFSSSLIPFILDKNLANNLVHWQWQLISFTVLFQWFNVAVIFRSVPAFGFFFVMIESILKKFSILLFVVFPLLIPFTISTKMIFFNQPAFSTVTTSIHKSSSMIIGEFDYETLFFSKATFTAAAFIFIPFIVIMCIIFINLLLGITVGDIKASIEHAQAKANAYWMRELIYIESTLPSKTWLKFNLIEEESTISYLQNTTENKIDAQEEKETLIQQSYEIELQKLVDVLDMLCTQAKQILEQQNQLEEKLKQLLTIKKRQISVGSTLGRCLSVK